MALTSIRLFALTTFTLFLTLESVVGSLDSPARCLTTEFRCMDQRQCVSSEHVCDGVQHCADRSDELKCDKKNRHCKTDSDNWFHCKTGNECINPSWKCDGHEDCQDGSDEQVCNSQTEAPVTCQPEEFQCANGLCIPMDLICDDMNDCVDSSDENRTMCESRPCTKDQFNCVKDGKCVPIRWRCDGSVDCTDGADEVNCNSEDPPELFSMDCPTDTFNCNDNATTCVGWDKVCDDKQDCPNGKDESPNCKTSCKHMNCEKGCRKNPIQGLNGTCTCPKGYQLNVNKIQCDDKNECLEFGICSQLCLNKDGSFECACKEGYSKFGNHCRAKGSVDATLFVSGKSEIFEINLRTGGEYVVTKEVDSRGRAFIGIGYDSQDDRVIWSMLENGKSSILSSRRDGRDKRVVVEDLVMVESLVVDHVARNIYYSEPSEDYLGVCSIDGLWCAKLHYHNVRQPREIALYPPAGLLFFTDWGLSPKIGRVGMDGEMAQTVVSTDLFWPNGITVDNTIKRVFWSDAKHDRIESSFFDGSDRRQTETNSIKHPFSLAVFEDRIYWSDWDLKIVQSCDKFTGVDRSFIFNGTEKYKAPFGIHIYHPSLELMQPNPCVHKPCSHLCLLAYGGRKFTCKCPENMTLAADERNCHPNQMLAKPTMKPKIQVEDGKTVTSILVEDMSDSDAVKIMQDEQRLKLGLGIGIVVFITLTVFSIFCIVSYRKNKDQPSPVLRYKNPAFGFDESIDGSEDMDVVVDGSPSPTKSLKKSQSDLTQKLDGTWQPPIIESHGSSPNNARSAFNLWRPRSNNKYYKL